jgi:hypothetical protein
VNSYKEISSLIISMDEIIGKLNAFFTDSVILEMNYNIQALGSEVESFIGFSSSELCGHAFSNICADNRLPDIIQEEIKHGYFDGLTSSFLTRENERVNVKISGFYLGLISDINGYIILKVKLLEDNSFLKKELVTKKRELDSFIYRTAHDLRGPIATIKGLVNLMKMRQGDHEVDALTSLIEVHANKLDDRLFKLLYVADENCAAEDCKGVIHFPILKYVLEKTLENNFKIDNTVFEFTVCEKTLYYINECRVTHLLNNVLLYIIGLPISTISREQKIIIAMHFEIHSNKLQVRIRVKGFVACENTKDIICQPISFYSDILNHPFLFNYYVAQREAKKLNGQLWIDFLETDEQILYLSIPLDFSMAIELDKN